MTALPDLGQLTHEEKNALIRALWAQVQALTARFWVDLPKGLRAADAVRKATDAGVRVTAGEAFSVASSPNAVRPPSDSVRQRGGNWV